tara:strand:- start:802 stop:1014 length:213 start_codon:yes stop_codon:yes gene_type:complete
MEIILTKHARKRMIERGIKLNEVEEVVNLPDYTIKQKDNIESYKIINNRTLKIVHRKEHKFIKIITVIEK